MRRALYLWYQNFVSRRNTGGHSLAIPIEAAGTNRQHFGFVQFLHTAFGQEETTSSLCFCLDPLDEDAIEERSKGGDGLECGSLDHLATDTGTSLRVTALTIFEQNFLLRRQMFPLECIRIELYGGRRSFERKS